MQGQDSQRRERCAQIWGVLQTALRSECSCSPHPFPPLSACPGPSSQPARRKFIPQVALPSLVLIKICILPDPLSINSECP